VGEVPCVLYSPRQEALRQLPLLAEYTVLKNFSPCPENRVCREIFHCIEIFFITQVFSATCACPENIVCSEFTVLIVYFFIIQDY